MSIEAAQRLLTSVQDLDLAAARIGLFLASLPDANQEVPEYRRVQMTDEVAVHFAEVIRVARGRFDGDQVLREYNPGSKPDSHEIEYASVADLPFISTQIEPLGRPARIPVFAAEEEFITSLRFYCIELRHQRTRIHFCRIYGKHHELQHSSNFGLWFRRGQFDQVRDPVFIFDRYVDCILSDEVMLILNQNNFQRIFRYFEMVERVAEESLDRIRTHIPISNFETFAAACRGHQQKLAKLKNIAQKPYLTRITVADLRRVIERYGLPVAIDVQNGVEMLVYDPSDRWAILRLLDDDYLESIMTEQKYEVTGKRMHATVLTAGRA